MVVALEAGLNLAGVTRVRCARGWLSTVASNGTALLEEVATAQPPAAGPAVKSQGTGKPRAKLVCGTVSSSFTVVHTGGAMARAGFDPKAPSSAVAGKLSHGTTVRCRRRAPDRHREPSLWSHDTPACWCAQITALEQRKLPSGVLRLRFAQGPLRGWVSTHAGDGTPLLVAEEAEEEEAEEAEEDDDDDEEDDNDGDEDDDDDEEEEEEEDDEESEAWTEGEEEESEWDEGEGEEGSEEVSEEESDASSFY